MPTKPPFVLLHGGRHGGWCWKRVAPLLRAAGHEVYTPTLTGLGERAHLLSPSIGLDTHIADLLGVFEAEELNDVVLVAHSYGGMVACGALESLRERVRSLVLLDAHMPADGQAVFDLVDPEKVHKMKQLVATDGDGWFVPVSDSRWWGLRDEDDIRWVNSRITPQPVRSYTDPVGSTAYARTHPYTFIECSDSALWERELQWQRQRAAGSPDGIRHVVIEGCHDVMVTEPAALAKLLVSVIDAPKGAVLPA
jgi:pimeloyl-ACP methyl ester carboxylesterase